LITKTKPLIAVTNNLSVLDLDQHKVRCDVGEHQWLSPDGMVFVLVCHPRHWRVAANYLESKGAAVAPHLHDTKQVGQNFAAMLPENCGVTPTDTAWQAAEKMSQVFGWPAIDPVEL